MKFLCLMPVWNHRTDTISNAIQCFLDQTHKDAVLVICDDRPSECQIVRVHNDPKNVLLVKTAERIPSLPLKYTKMLEAADGIDWDAVAIWDDDDGFLPLHLELAAEMYADPSVKWTYPDTIFADYLGLNKIPTEGRFWSSITVSRELLEQIGGFQDTKACAHDQMFMNRINKIVPPGRPEIPSYVYRWGENAENHCSGYSQGAADETWWGKTPHSCTGSLIVPSYDPWYLNTLLDIRNRFPEALSR